MEFEIINCKCYDIKTNFYKINKQGIIIEVDSGLEIKPWSDRDGYQLVNLLRNDNVQSVRRLHRIVASQFIFTDNYSLQVNHKDGNKKNNSVDNLEWVTCAQNIQHAGTTGLRGFGQSHPTAIYTESDIIEICELYEMGYCPSLVALEFGWDYSIPSIKYLLQDIYSGKRWSYISNNYTFLKRKQSEIRTQFKSKKYTFFQIKDICLQIKQGNLDEEICKNIFGHLQQKELTLIKNIRNLKKYTCVSKIFL